MSYQNIIVEKKGKVGKLSINRPDVRNALNRETRLEIERGVIELEGDAEIRVIVITGVGEKAFCAGADIRDMKDATPLQAIESAELGKRVFKRVENCKKPVIAMINGFALGGGCELALSCDIRIASDNARLGQPEINIGIIPGYAGTQRLPRLVGKAVAMELILTGDLIKADEAYRVGLVSKVVPLDQLEAAVMEVADKLAQRSPVILEIAKSAVNKGLETNLDVGSAYETECFGIAFSTQDHHEGINAFLEKRPPEFKGL